MYTDNLVPRASPRATPTKPSSTLTTTSTSLRTTHLLPKVLHTAIRCLYSSCTQKLYIQGVQIIYGYQHGISGYQVQLSSLTSASIHYIRREGRTPWRCGPWNPLEQKNYILYHVYAAFFTSRIVYIIHHCIYQVLRAGMPDGINDFPRYGMSKYSKYSNKHKRDFSTKQKKL